MDIGVINKRGIILLISLMVVMTASGCAQNKTVKVGIEQNFRPYTFTEGGEQKGFSGRFMAVIAKKSKLKYELVPMEMGELNKGLKSGKIDLAIAEKTVSDAQE